MTIIVLAIHMHIAGFTALVAVRKNIPGDAFPDPFVKYKVYAPEPAVEVFFLYFFCVLDDASLQVIYILKSLVLKISAGLFATDTTRAVHYNFLILLTFQVIDHEGELFAERVGIGTESPVKSAH